MTAEKMTETVHNLRELMRMREELDAEIEAAQDAIKAEMTETGEYEKRGTDWKCTWNEVTQNKLDGKALRAALPEIAEQFTKKSTYRRFLVA